MNNLVSTRTPQAPFVKSFKPSLLIQLNEAYKTYRKFKNLTDENLADMGLTRLDQAEARFGDFCCWNKYS